MPAIGPIRPVFTELMASSLMSAPAARSSSIAMTTPWITPPTSGCVLKKTRWRFSAALMSSLLLYNFLMMGVILCAKPIPCMRSQLYVEWEKQSQRTKAWKTSFCVSSPSDLRSSASPTACWLASPPVNSTWTYATQAPMIASTNRFTPPLIIEVTRKPTKK